MLSIRKVSKIILIVMLLWVSIFAVDWFTVSCLGYPPIFCVKDDDRDHFSGVGYSYDAYHHPISGKFEYCLYVFDFVAASTFTN